MNLLIFHLTLQSNNNALYLVIYKPPDDGLCGRNMQRLNETIKLIKPLTFLFILIEFIKF
jgi:hypothetical protein